MLSRKGKIIVGSLLCVLALVVVVSSLREGYERRQALSQALLMLETADPALRFQAAQVVIDRDPDHAEARLIHAHEMYRRSNFPACRADIEALPKSASPQQVLEGNLLIAHSFIAQARQTVENAPSRGVDTVGGQVAELLSPVASYRQIIESTSDDPQLPLILQALEADTRAMYLRAVLQNLNQQILQTRAASQNQEIKVLALQTSDDQAQLEYLENQVLTFCQQALTYDPLSPQPLLLMIKRHLRQGDAPAARELMEKLALRESLEVDFALEAANQMLHLERRYYLETTPRDAALVQAVLDRVPELDRDNVEMRFARAQIALKQGRYADADAILKNALSDPRYLGHAHGVCLRGKALMGLGKHHEAEQLLARLNDRSPTWEGKLVQGQAMIATGKSGMDLLRQAQELSPGSLEVRMAICKALINSGGVEVAELDIAELARMAPMHSQVIDLRMQLAADMGQRSIIDEYIQRVYGDHLIELSPDDVQLIALLVLDDVDALGQLSQRMLARQYDHPLAILASRWSTAKPSSRARTAWHVAQAMVAVVDNDPMRWPSPPTFTAWQRRQAVKARELLGQPDPGLGMQLLEGSVYLAWPYESALSVVEAGLQRWPQETELTQLAARLSLWLGKESETQAYLQDLPSTEQGLLERAILAYLIDDAGLLDSTLTTAAATPSTDPTWELLGLLRHLRRGDDVATATAVRHLLGDHPRAEPALLWVARQMLAQDKGPQLDAMLSQMRDLAPQLVAITEARLLFARNQVGESTRSLSMVGIEALTDSTIRWQQVEIELLAAVSRNQPVVAMGMFETLALSIPSQNHAIYVSQVDMMTDGQRDRLAATILFQQLGGPMASHWMDQYLARAMELAEPVRLLQELDEILASMPNHPLALYYRAQLLRRMGLKAEAKQAISHLQSRRPDSSRTLMLLAQVAMEEARIDDARNYLTQMASQGREAQRTARRYLNQLIIAQPATSTPAAAPAGGAS